MSNAIGQKLDRADPHPWLTIRPSPGVAKSFPIPKLASQTRRAGCVEAPIRRASKNQAAMSPQGEFATAVPRPDQPLEISWATCVQFVPSIEAPLQGRQTAFLVTCGVHFVDNYFVAKGTSHRCTAYSGFRRPSSLGAMELKRWKTYLLSPIIGHLQQRS